MDYVDLKEQLEKRQFALGGNWDYLHGSFDRSVHDDHPSVWLRIPFQVIHGSLDANTPEPGTRVKLGQPYVLRHLYQKGNDDTADFAIASALVNQFQSPQDPDAELFPADIEKAESILREVEAAIC